MTKKLFEAPYLKVVEVKNDVIATSTGSLTDQYYEGDPTLAPGRRGMWDDDFSEEDIY